MLDHPLGRVGGSSPAADGLAFRYSIFPWTKVFFFVAPRVCRTGCVRKASSK